MTMMAKVLRTILKLDLMVRTWVLEAGRRRKTYKSGEAKSLPGTWL
jgi:hypothetical protein